MRAALWLRLLESWRRGGPVLLVGGAGAAFAVALLGGDTADGRYGLATDLAALLGYLGAVFLGAFPIAVDRERKRSYLAGASPVSPWEWAAGNGLGAGLGAGACALAFFLAAGLGAAAAGGIETHDVTRVGGRGIVVLEPGRPLPVRKVPADATRLRIRVRSVLVETADAVGTPDAATLLVDGTPYPVFDDVTLEAPVTPPTIELESASPEFVVGIYPESARVLGAERPFLLNAARAAWGPALGAAALAVVAAAAGAHLSAAVAALLTAIVLLVAGLKGFLLETLEHEGAARAAMEGHDHGHDHAHGHDHGPAPDLGALRGVAKGIVAGLLAVLPDLAALDHTAGVALGEWLDATGAARGLALLAVALALATLLGGLGVKRRRMP